MTKKLIVLACNGLLIILLFLFLEEGTGLTKWINALFYITVMNMILFLYLFILKGKFFDGITHGFQRLLKKSHVQESTLPSDTVNITTYQIFKFNFFTLISALVTAQVVYFVIT